ncbi:MAG: signal transduction histidine kinase [Planctomycetota bacterium]|jgi:signal transduction histidine kinase
MSAKRTLLIVDDEPDIIQSLQDLLRRDYRVIGATNPEDGLKLLAKEDVQVIMSDQRMPGMQGVEFLGRCHELSPHAVRLLFTGYADLVAVIDAINEGQVYRYINKPWIPLELEATIREAFDHWELQAEKRTLVQDLETANASLAATNEALLTEKELRSSFIKVLSHELRTPLTILLAAIDMTRRCGVEKSEMWLNRIDDAGLRLKNLVGNLVSALEAGRFETLIERAPTDITELVKIAAEDIRPFIELRKQVLDVSIANGIGSIDLDASKMRNLIDNLLTNAVKFTPDGGRIGIAAERAKGGALHLTVKDDGDGVTAATADRVFEEFFTDFDVSHHSSGNFAYRTRGLGLGLAVVKAIVELHDGTIDVQSEVGKGTQFIVVIPDSNLGHP